MLRLLELYSGIGGMRYAFEASGFLYEVVAAIDINTVVNDIYCHNFGSKNHIQRNIQSLTVQDIEHFAADIITLSPPCQPFTRLGLKLDSGDPRNESFLHFLNIFCKLKQKPQYILLENVMGFETSDAREKLIECLNKCGYSYQEFLLSPIQFGIPNSRMRYYIIAKKQPLQFDYPITNQVLHCLPKEKDFQALKYPCNTCNAKSSKDSKCTIEHFLENNTDSYFENFKLPASILSKKHAFVLDIVEVNSTSSCCFTKGYKHFLHGTGSVLHPPNSTKVSDMFEAASKTEDVDEKIKYLTSLNLRYFTPIEIANLMCFPQSFSFPANITLKQKYRALGNSINVFVVSNLLKLLITET